MTFVEILLASHRSDRRRQRGYRALFLALVLVLTGGSLLLLTALLAPWSACACQSKLSSASMDTRNLAAAVERFRLQYDRCPAGLGELKAGGVIARHHRDPWGREFAFGCDRDEVEVCSLGQETLDPRDDICSSDDDTPGWQGRPRATWTARAARRRLIDTARAAG